MKYGRFSGNPQTEWLVNDGAERDMRLLADFTYTDPSGRAWVARRGSVVNGASIPSYAWSVIGSPYVGNYRRASIVHDVACEDVAVDRRDADRMFYWACLAGGCGLNEARWLYAGVRAGDRLTKRGVPGVRGFNPIAVGVGSPLNAVSEDEEEAAFRELVEEVSALPDEYGPEEVDALIERRMMRW